jgi:hypothetical protein
MLLRGILVALLIAVAALLHGCATPTERVDALAASHGFVRSVVRGAEFQHVVFENGKHGDLQSLHVYLEGDGSPYLDRWTVAADPTPRSLVMLDLMALDPSPAVYVGRPCYFGLASDPPCTPVDWTLGRFSERVVVSLAAAIEGLRRQGGFRSLALFGHSGGGTLAVLLAARLQGVNRVVTLAGNLVPDAWASYHDYSPLSQSLNPVRQGPLPVGIRQLHLVGTEDKAVPPALVEAAVPRLGEGRVELLAGATHTCCWRNAWALLMETQ